MIRFVLILTVLCIASHARAQQLPQPESGLGSTIEGSRLNNKLAASQVQKFSDPVQKFSSPVQKFASPVQKSAASERRPGPFGNGPVFGAGGVERRKARREARDARG